MSGCSKDGTKTSSESSGLNDSTSVNEFNSEELPSVTPSVTPTDISEEEASPFENMNVYSAGQYKIGTDMPEGEYMILSTGGSGYFSVTADANGDDIIFNSNFDINSIIEVYENEYLELSRSYAIPVDEFYSEYSILTDSPGVMLRVGFDLPAGEYKLESVSDAGYYCIYNSSRQDDIISNNNFSGNNYITVNEGEYLELSRCFITE